MGVCMCLLLDVSSDVSTKFGRLYSTFVDAPPLRLMHIGKQEVLGLIDLMEDEWDQLLVLDPAAYGLKGTIDPTVDPQQVRGVHGVMVKKPAKKLKEQRSLTADNLGFCDTFEYKWTEAYLKANSEDANNPLTMFPVSRCYVGC